MKPVYQLIAEEAVATAVREAADAERNRIIFLLRDEGNRWYGSTTSENAQARYLIEFLIHQIEKEHE